jgi:hypothetical protein
MPEIEPPADVSCSRCGSAYLELSHSRTLYDHDTKRNVRVAQWYCPWCHSYTPSKWLKSWDNPETDVDTSKDFELDSGRFKGQRISDVFDDPKGVRYLHKIAEKDPKVRSWLELTKAESSR